MCVYVNLKITYNNINMLQVHICTYTYVLLKDQSIHLICLIVFNLEFLYIIFSQGTLLGKSRNGIHTTAKIYFIRKFKYRFFK